MLKQEKELRGQTQALTWAAEAERARREGRRRQKEQRPMGRDDTADGTGRQGRRLKTEQRPMGRGDRGGA
jgi:hypothetical protein